MLKAYFGVFGVQAAIGDHRRERHLKGHGDDHGQPGVRLPRVEIPQGDDLRLQAHRWAQILRETLAR